MALIYVADDQEDVVSAVQGLLERDGLEVRGFHDGAALIQAVEDNAPDLIVTDVYMPGMDGIEVLIRLAAVDPDVPVVVMSGGGFTPKEFVLSEAGQLGAAAVISKPFEMAEMRSVVRGILGASGESA